MKKNRFDKMKIDRVMRIWKMEKFRWKILLRSVYHSGNYAQDISKSFISIG